MGRLPAAESSAKLYTHMNVKEDDLSLFGFLTMEELKMFDRLITVKGVGPKGATAMLAALTPAQISLAIISDDVKTLSSCPGIGKKTAQQIILDLKDKTATMDAAGASLSGGTAAVKADSGERADAAEALLSLGFGRPEVTKALDAVFDEGLTSAELIARALKVL